MSMRAFFRKKNLASLHYKFIGSILIASFIIPFSITLALPKPKEAEAFFGGPVIEVGANLAVNSASALSNSIVAFNSTFSTVKESGLDGVLWAIAKIFIQRMTAGVVSWINSGFNGAPAFVSNPQAFFLNISDKLAGEFIRNHPDLNFLCSPFNTEVRLALTSQYSDPFGDRVRCTLTGVVGNIQDFTNDFGNGGWIAWHTMTQQSANNPIGAFLEADSQMRLNIDNAKITEKAKLDWGRGMLSWTDDSGVIQTPGAVIHDQLSNALGSGYRTLELADEFNEIIAALIGQLVNRVLGPGGLRGESAASIDDNGTSVWSGSGVIGGQPNRVPPKPTPYVPAQNNLASEQRQVVDANGNPVVDANGNPVYEQVQIFTGVTTGSNVDGGAGNYLGGYSTGTAIPTGSGDSYAGGNCNGGVCTNGTYTSPFGAVYIGGTYTGGTCTSTTCTGGSFSGGTCVANCGFGGIPTLGGNIITPISGSGGGSGGSGGSGGGSGGSGGGGIPSGPNPALPGTFSTGSIDGSGLACTRSGSTEQFVACSGPLCPYPVAPGPSGFMGYWTFTTIMPDTQCGACTVGPGSMSCDWSAPGNELRNCTVSYSQIIDSACN